MVTVPRQSPEPPLPYRARSFTLYPSPSSRAVAVWLGVAGKTFPVRPLHARKLSPTLSTMHGSPQAYRRGIPGNLDRAVPDAGQGDLSCVTWVRWCRRGFNGGVGDGDIQRVGGDDAIIDGQRECNCGVHIDCRSNEGCDKL